MPRGRRKRSGDDMLLKSADMIGWAIGGIEREIVQTRERLAALVAQAARLREKLGRSGSKAAAAVAPGGAAEPRKRRRRKMSPEARKRISDMMKKRWAERRKAK